MNLIIQKGKKVDILGKTGCGKSTLLQLLVRNYDANQGQLFLAGKPIADYAEDTLRSLFCFLTQRVHVFSDTLRQNLQFASAVNISDKKMIEVLNQVGLGKLLEQEQGLDIWLGDGGRPLSGGEQRRLGLARNLLNDAPILLLDDFMSELDEKRRNHFLEKIEKTQVIITCTDKIDIENKNILIYNVKEGKVIRGGN